jgi:hypothetical protein
MPKQETVLEGGAAYRFYSNTGYDEGFWEGRSAEFPHSYARHRNGEAVLAALATGGAIVIRDDIRPVDSLGREIPGRTLFVREGVAPRLIEGLQSRLSSGLRNEFGDSQPESLPGVMLYQDEVAELVGQVMAQNGLADKLTQLVA